MTNVMVCVTQQRTCDRLIKFGKKLVHDEGGELFIIHIAPYEFKFLGKSKEGEALEYLYQKALEYGANLTVIRSSNVPVTLSELVDKNKIDKVIMGATKETDKKDSMIAKFEDTLHGKAELIVVPQGGAK